MVRINARFAALASASNSFATPNTLLHDRAISSSYTHSNIHSNTDTNMGVFIQRDREMTGGLWVRAMIYFTHPFTLILHSPIIHLFTHSPHSIYFTHTIHPYNPFTFPVSFSSSSFGTGRPEAMRSLTSPCMRVSAAHSTATGRRMSIANGSVERAALGRSSTTVLIASNA